MNGQTVSNKNYPLGNTANMPPAWKRKNYNVVYQGDVSTDTRMYNSVTFAAGGWFPTGSVCSIDKNNVAKTGVAKGTAGNHPMAYVVAVGNDRMEVQSERGNAAGGLLTLLPCAGYYRVRTTVFDADSSLTYEIGDLLSVGEIEHQGKTCSAVTKKNNKPYENVIVGSVDAPVDLNKEGLPALSFTCYWLPAQEA
jgi:hypothetical protein|nr:MAG TPA: hypothetical protein [Herelleviridae sp.]